MTQSEDTPALPSGARDFDFLHGDWRILNRRLTERLVGADTWDEFEASLTVRPILGGLGNVDEFSADWKGRKVDACTLRVFNPESGQWSLYWVDNISAVLQPPVVGSFSDGLGLFYADDHHGDIPVLVRFQWSEITGSSARWDQAFSTDDGETWETNWVMEFTRVSDPG
ncbi:MAG: hypothetical protein KDI71_23330 [Xanthomonadales bacterium]|nr:hypothetical protein [Xanthomonadales bacterium]